MQALEQWSVTVVVGNQMPMKYQLDSFNKEQVWFGRDTSNDIVISSEIVSARHGYFKRTSQGWWIIDAGSTNGIYLGQDLCKESLMANGLVYRIDDRNLALANGVSLFIECEAPSYEWKQVPMQGRGCLTIGRAEDCDIVLPHISVSNHHAKIVFENGRYYIYDCDSTNGISVNGVMVHKKRELKERDLIVITTTKLIFGMQYVAYQTAVQGIHVAALDVVKTVKVKKKKVDIASHISLEINPGEFVAIIGGSGAGKTTFMNCLSGYNQATSGQVLINGIDLVSNYEIIKSIIGYVPQQDLVYDNLTLFDMLAFAAKLRMPKDTTETERRQRIAEVIENVELNGKEQCKIGSLSGGQKKRASIAVELLSDPKLFFLDEPTSGLDPGTERNLMRTLSKMSKMDKTVILVTHNTLNLHLCDKLIVLGRGGRLCFCGTPNETKAFFGVDDLVDIYNLINENSLYWEDAFYRRGNAFENVYGDGNGRTPIKRRSMSVFLQLRVLSLRYLKLILNDTQRMLILLLQAPFLAVLIYIVTDGTEFSEYESTKGILFALCCCAFWIGVLNSIQEICKERVILKREYRTGISLGAYLASKFIILGGLCFIQALGLLGVFALLVGMPEYDNVAVAFLKLYITTFITMLSATSMGLFVSSLFKNVDRAMTVAPILLMPQILFSGLLFELSGATELVSYVVNSRWTMEGYGTICNLNDLSLAIQKEVPAYLHEEESFFVYEKLHLYNSWLILLLFSIVFGALCLVALKRTLRQGS